MFLDNRFSGPKLNKFFDPYLLYCKRFKPSLFSDATQTKIHLGIEFDSGVGLTCFILRHTVIIIIVLEILKMSQKWDVVGAV